MKTFAWVFPGQGSQSLGLCADLAERWPAVKQTFEEASDALGWDVWALAQEGPEAEQNATEKTQPLLLTAGIAAWRIWLAEGGARPVALAGHSLGEYTALVAAESLSLADGVRLVATRGRLMQAAVPVGQGAMAAILGLSDEAVEAACAEAAQGDVVSAVNYNAPGQVVIAGTAEAVSRAIAACKASGAKRALPLPVSVPSHCALMQPAADALAAVVNELTCHLPVIPVVQNVHGRTESTWAGVREALLAQLSQPVRWVQCVQQLQALGVTHLIESGPGQVLTGLNKRIAPDLQSVSVHRAESLTALLNEA